MSNVFVAGAGGCEASSQQGARAALGASQPIRETRDEASRPLSATGASQLRRVFVAGIGAVSPAGWGVGALRAALEKNEPLSVQTLARPGPGELRRAAVADDLPPVRNFSRIRACAAPARSRITPPPPRSKPLRDCVPIPPRGICGWASSAVCSPVACSIPAGFTMRF